VLQRALRSYEESGKELPDTLYVQLDNTCKQNKSRFLMAYLGELVRAGVFSEVYVSFLPVGHTHEDIDQMFSRFAMAIRVHDTVHVTMDEMAEVFTQAYLTVEGFRPAVSTVHSVANISDHVDPITSGWSEYGIAQYYQFHIFAERTPDGRIGQPLIRGRQSTVGDEIFSGLYKHAFHSCDTSTPIFDEPTQQIEWEKIGPSQLQERNEKSLVEYKKTILKGH
jgi:hypothetical protein